MSATLVVLHSVQPLTSQLVTEKFESIRILTDDVSAGVTATDQPPSVEVVVAPRESWLSKLREWTASGPVEVATNDEYCLTYCARLRDDLGLESRHPLQLDHYLDKVSMKRALESAGLLVPLWADLDVVPAAGASLPSDLSFPVVAKPRQEANSRGVRVIRDQDGWNQWLADREGQTGWQVEAHIEAPMYFIDAAVIDGRYVPLILGQYFGPLLPQPGNPVLGAIEVARDEPLWSRACAFGEQVAHALGSDGRFVTHLEFFETQEGLMVMEAAARAPGALVSEMGRVAVGIDLETLHLDLQSGGPIPRLMRRSEHSAWISLLATPQQVLHDPPAGESQVKIFRRQPRAGTTGRYVAALALLTHDNLDVLRRDSQAWRGHRWLDE